MAESGGTILKTYTGGRVQTLPERRESLLDEFERSGFSGVEFAKLAGIKYQTQSENVDSTLWPDGGAEGVRTPDLLNAIQKATSLSVGSN